MRAAPAYVEEVLTLDEYSETRARMLKEKLALKEKSTQIEKNPSYWLEPAEDFVKSLCEVNLTTASADPAEKLKLL